MTEAGTHSATMDGDPARSRVWGAAFAGIVVLGLAAVFVSPVRQGISIVLDRAEMVSMRKPSDILAFASPVGLSRHFATIGYDLESVRVGTAAVPRIFLARVPRGLAELEQTKERKAVFLRLMLPLILEANERVLRQRAQLLVIDAKLAAGYRLTPEQRRRLERIAAEYATDPERIDLLLRKVDAVPPSLALAQAAIESGWGTSRFVIEGNAAFGQWTTAAGDGIVPLGRAAGKTHKIRSFRRLIDSVHAYLRNLNTHNAYREFRSQRTMMRAEGTGLAGSALASEMGAYSETEDRYLKLLRRVIKTNNLQPLDGARLTDERQDLGSDV